MTTQLMPDVSVLMATRDRASAAERSLFAILEARELVPDMRIEIVVVENGLGTVGKNISRISQDTFEEYQDLRFIAEARSGLSLARNRAIAEAKGRILVFIDDDCLMDPSYFEELKSNLQGIEGAWEGDALFLLGGRVLLADPEDQPFTLRLLAEREIFSTDQHPGGFVQGCNLITSRKTLDHIGVFDVRFGGGAQCKAADDTDIIVRAFNAGIQVHCYPNMTVSHAHGRRTVGEVKSLAAAYAYGDGALYAKHWRQAPWLLKHFYWTMRGAFRELRGGPLYCNIFQISHWRMLKGNLGGMARYVSPPPFIQTSGYRPQLDGLRAIALLLVLLQHFWLTETAIGHVGVRIFFVLSGFLITKQLVQGRSIQHFYQSRFARLFPAFALGLLAAVLMNYDGATHYWKWHLAQLTNVLLVRLGDWGEVWPVGHFWSLNIESQFYMVWPVLLLLLKRIFFLPLMLVCIATGIVWRFGAELAGAGEALRLLPMGEIDALAMGGLLAIASVPRVLKIGALALAPSLVLMSFPSLFPSMGLWHQIGLLLSLPAFAALIFAGQACRMPLLERGLPALGRISYGAYVYHWILYAGFEKFGLITPGPLTFVWLTAATIAVAFVSFHKFEKKAAAWVKKIPLQRRQATSRSGT